MAALTTSTNNLPVVVWTYLNSRHLWKAYEPDLCHYIENAFSGSGGSGKVFLGIVAPSTHLAAYDIHFGPMKQIHISSGKECPVQRSVLSLSSPLSKGVVWEFEGDDSISWVTFDLDTMHIIEDAFTQLGLGGNISSPVIDLRRGSLPQPYIIDMVNKTQTRVCTGRVRKIQRRPLAQSYPLETANLSASVSLSTTGQGSVYSSQPLSSSVGVVISKGRQSKRQRATPYSTAIPKTLNSTLQGGVVLSQSQAIAALAQAKVLSQMQQLKSGSNNVIASQQQQQQISQQQCSNSMQWQQSPNVLQWQSQLTTQSGQTSNIQQTYLGHTQQYTNPQSFISGYGASGPSLIPTAINQSSTQGSSQASFMSGSNNITESLPSESLITLPKLKKISKAKAQLGEKILTSFMQPITEDLELTDCTICFDKLSEASAYGEDHPDGHVAISLSKCGHQFHKLCLLQMYQSIHKDSSLQCPSCKTIYGEKTGNCPPGTMGWRLMSDLHLPGHEDCDTISVWYNIPSGTQGPDQPNPGKRFSARGFPRTGYLPNCNKGRKLLKLLILAFKRRLMFTIATSFTTGETNTVTWNEIHHKTEPLGNGTGHGFPDPNYIDNALLELSAHGVTENCLTQG